MELIRHCDKEFSVTAQVEPVSRRIWVSKYETDNPGALRGFLLDLARRQEAEKIIFPVRTEHADKMQGEGFNKEGIIKGYYSGVDAHFLAAFPIPRRSTSLSLVREKKMLRRILSNPGVRRSITPPGFTLRLATMEDAPLMAELFKKVFESYPSPVYDPAYLANSMKNGNVFMTARRRHHIVCVAAAEIDRKHSRAELTNCATLPDCRGMGLSTILLSAVEELCLSMGVNCLYSLSRGPSYAMNLVFHRLGYMYGGTLINNCQIGGGLENMNIWVRHDGQHKNKLTTQEVVEQ